MCSNASTTRGSAPVTKASVAACRRPRCSRSTSGSAWAPTGTPSSTVISSGKTHALDRLPALLEAAPRGQFIGNMPVVELDGDHATGMQHFVFIDQTTHAMRLGWYRNEYVRTAEGWRIRRRATTFMRKHGGFDSGRQHDPLSTPS